MRTNHSSSTLHQPISATSTSHRARLLGRILIGACTRWDSSNLSSRLSKLLRSITFHSSNNRYRNNSNSNNNQYASAVHAAITTITAKHSCNASLAHNTNIQPVSTSTQHSASRRATVASFVRSRLLEPLCGELHTVDLLFDSSSAFKPLF
jgi:hypothetical protein